jgi:probable phosphoglycerate mutase
MCDTTIFLIRHGETVDNALQIMQGQTQGELNEQGREQARQVAQRLAAQPVDVFISSDLHRAIQTAEIIAAPHGMPVKQTPLLRERDWGSFTGRFIPDLKGEVWPDDIESEPALLQRASDFLQYVTTTYPGKRVVAVGHGIINKAILAVYAGCTMREVQRMLNAEVRILTTSSERAAASAAAAMAATTAAASAKASARSAASVATSTAKASSAATTTTETSAGSAAATITTATAE